jgi:hypothetical protein
MACEEQKFESVVFVVKSDHKYSFSGVGGVLGLRWYASILLNLEICVMCSSKLVLFLVERVRIFLMQKLTKQMFADVILTIVTAAVFR